MRTLTQIVVRPLRVKDKLSCIFLRQILGYYLYVCQKGGEFVMGSIPVEDSDFEMSDARDTIDIASFYFQVVT